MTVPLGDGEVMAKVRDGHVEMLAILFERYHVRLFNFFVRLTGHRGHSEDLVQEVFLRVLKYRHAYRSEAEFTPWLFQIARNAHLSHLRSLPPLVPLEESQAQFQDASERADVILERNHEAVTLKRALNALPAKKRELLLLSRRPDLSYQDVACLLECTVSAVKVQVHRAMKDLRKAYLEVQGGMP